MIHTVKDFGIVNKEEIDVFLELSCLFKDLADVGNLISGSSAFSKTSLNVREFAVWLRKLKQALYINLEVWDGREMGGRFKREGIYVHLFLIHVEV